MRIRFSFADWAPDLDDFGNEFLTVADNVIHDTEGYKEVNIVTAGALGTQGGLGTVISMRALPIGTAGQTLKCWLEQISGPALSLRVGVSVVSTLDQVDSATLTSAGGGAITSFSVVDTDDALFITAEAAVDTLAGFDIINITGYSTYSF